MGKGDLKSRRGKLVNGSYGVRRRKKKDSSPVKPVAIKKAVKAPAAKPKAAPRKKKEA